MIVRCSFVWIYFKTCGFKKQPIQNVRPKNIGNVLLVVSSPGLLAVGSHFWDHDKCVSDIVRWFAHRINVRFRICNKAKGRRWFTSYPSVRSEIRICHLQDFFLLLRFAIYRICDVIIGVLCRIFSSQQGRRDFTPLNLTKNIFTVIYIYIFISTGK